jgi:pimeloyl-ACP methyl ester carboxylesterase
VKRFYALLLALIFPSCALIPRPTPSPVRSLAGGNSEGKELIVFLPGRWSHVKEFEKENFFDIAHKLCPDARLLAADLHLGYYKNRSMARRLHEDIILPARRSGVEKISIVGISMGGLGALIYDTEYPGQADSLILLSPYLGEESALEEIEASGGLSQWKPGAISERDYTRKLWLRLREERFMKTDSSPTEILLGCGNEDRLAASNRLFAKEFLKPEAQEWIVGNHDWPTWRILFEKLAVQESSR